MPNLNGSSGADISSGSSAASPVSSDTSPASSGTSLVPPHAANTRIISIAVIDIRQKSLGFIFYSFSIELLGHVSEILLINYPLNSPPMKLNKICCMRKLGMQPPLLIMDKRLK